MASSTAEFTPRRTIARLQSGLSPCAPSLPPGFHEDFRHVFDLFDKERRGAIDPKELRAQMGALGFAADNATIYQLISDLDSDGSQTLEFDEFQSLMCDHLQVTSAEYASRRSYREVFDFMDDLEPAQRKGRVGLFDLRRMAEALGDTVTDEELEAMLSCADREGKGFVSCEDFYQMMVEPSVPGSATESSDDSDGDEAPALLAGRSGVGFASGRSGKASASASPMGHSRSVNFAFGAEVGGHAKAAAAGPGPSEE
mmetsp:Transcript_118056/g.328207  ORF Transcript_118056/g.328207 Transcript_118056/m.328207 type:complete len:256 (+) Transcript_118056:83-850(+)